jgi:hypothetical protein
MDGVHLTTEDNRGRTGQHATDRQPTTCGGRGAYIAQQATRHWPRRGTLARPAAECCQDCLASLVARTCAQVFVWSITSQAVLQVIEAPEAGACVCACVRAQESAAAGSSGSRRPAAASARRSARSQTHSLTSRARTAERFSELARVHSSACNMRHAARRTPTEAVGDYWLRSIRCGLHSDKDARTFFCAFDPCAPRLFVSNDGAR